jgi:hypothetical protein
MASYLILAQSDITARALKTWLSLIDEEEQFSIIVSSDKFQAGGAGAVSIYENLVRRIEDEASDKSGIIPLNDVIVLVDSVELAGIDKDNGLNSIHDGGWDSLIAKLILTFPEIKFVFGLYTGSLPGEFNEEAHTLSTLLTPYLRDPIFDPTQLRNHARQKARNNIPARKYKAAAIDEENSYALFHAYTAYRFGYCADGVRSWGLMNELFSCDEQVAIGHEFKLLFEDVNLNFPDGSTEIHLSHFEDERASKCTRLGYTPPLETSDFRIIVSSGHSGASSKTMDDNEEYVQSHKPNGFGVVYKPAGGMFDLWRKAELFVRLPEDVSKQKGYAPDFIWPPVGKTVGNNPGHSAPGRLMLIAQHLVRRADSMRSTANTVEECIRGAVLATDALELLGFQTPTLSLQALCLKHEFEVKAEVAFLGVGYHLKLEQRFEELVRDVKVASQYFESNRRQAAELDTLVSIGNSLMLIFRNVGQFDEEMECLAQIRRWHRKLRLKQVSSPLEKLTQYIMSYAEWMLESPGRFVGMLVVWFFLFWFMKQTVGLFSPSETSNGLPISTASYAWNTFISNNPEKATTFPDLIYNLFATTVGTFHLGVFISYLYSAVTRK